MFLDFIVSGPAFNLSSLLAVKARLHFFFTLIWVLALFVACVAPGTLQNQIAIAYVASPAQNLETVTSLRQTENPGFLESGSQVTPKVVKAILPQNETFVRIENGHFTYNGQPIKLKGVNYYPHLAVWANMWQHWNGPQTAADLAKASDLGVNTLRVLVPYGAGYGWTTSDGTVVPDMLDELDQLVELAAAQNIRILLTLFDFYGGFPQAGTADEAANWHYLDTLVNHFRNDPRVLGWDLHNEPDNYSAWQNGRSDQVLDWLSRAVTRVKTVDTNHFVTIGFGNWQNLLTRSTTNDKLTALNLVDTVALHVYDPSNLEQQVADVTQAEGEAGIGSLPVILEEFGWPSAPIEVGNSYSEAIQAGRYQETLTKMNSLNLDGAIAWMLNDSTYESIIHFTPASIQQFGLIRLDGTMKPAGLVFRDRFTVAAFHDTQEEIGSSSNLPQTTQLTIRQVDPNLFAQYFPETGYAVPTPFKEYWNRMGGLTGFGYPISGVLVENGLLVQYFERARFEFHPERENTPGYASLPRSEQLKQIVLLGLLGDELVSHQNKSFPAAAPLADHQFFNLTGHNLGGVFQKFWEANGGLLRFGYPLSEEITEVSRTDGQPYLVQYFERARFEYHPELSGTAYVVELGQLGREQLPPNDSR